MTDIPLLVTVSWLKDQLSKDPPNVVVLDASYDTIRETADAFANAHIPGAVFFDLHECRDKSSPYRNTLPPPQDFAKYVGRLGVDNRTHLVIYDDNQRGLFSAPRVWWMFKQYGFDQISILDGGLAAWLAAGNTVTSSRQSKPPRTFHAVPRKDYVKSFDEVAACIRGPDQITASLVDVRPIPLFVAGHMPKAKNMAFTAILNDAPLTTLKDVEGLQKMFAAVGIDFSQPVIFYCTSGIASCTLFFAALLLGKLPPTIAVYDGSWCEWEKKAKGHPGFIEYVRKNLASSEKFLFAYDFSS